tara:strand:+ start:220 stop:468 length:249 start_codon:yes stop_codon:yes gene_type:complete
MNDDILRTEVITYSFNIDEDLLDKFEGTFEGVSYEIVVEDGKFYVIIDDEYWQCFEEKEGPFSTLEQAHRQARIIIFQVVVE